MNWEYLSDLAFYGFQAQQSKMYFPLLSRKKGNSIYRTFAQLINYVDINNLTHSFVVFMEKYDKRFADKLCFDVFHVLRTCKLSK